MVTMDTTGLAIDGYFGTWHTVNTQSKLTPGDDTESQPEQSKNKRPPVLEKLKEKQAVVLAKSKADTPLIRSSNDISHD